jgi:hypothetical protein
VFFFFKTGERPSQLSVISVKWSMASCGHNGRLVNITRLNRKQSLLELVAAYVGTTG